MLQPRYLLLTGMILVAASFRLIPYVMQVLGYANVHDGMVNFWNLTPLGALCLFAGARFADRRWAFGVPLLALALSDLGIGLLMRDVNFAIYPSLPIVYACFALTVWLGTCVRSWQGVRGVAGVVGAGLIGETVFFVVTNFAVWAIHSDHYAHTAAGLTECYVLALPFFRNSLLGMAIYSGALFGGFAWAERHIRSLRSAATDDRPVPA